MKEIDVAVTCKGVIAGLVSISAGCTVVDTWHAVVIGAIGSAIYLLASKIVLYCFNVRSSIVLGPLRVARR